MTPAATRRRVRVRTEADVTEAVRLARELALRQGMSRTDAIQLATAVSEVAANQVRHVPEGGTLTISSSRDGVHVEAADDGPGIDHLELALRDGWSSDGGLGLGLPGARRLMDTFEVQSRRRQGTVVRMAKLAQPSPAPLGVWAVSGNSALDPLEAVAATATNSLLLGIMDAPAAVAVRADPGAAASDPAAALGGERGVIACLSGRDGHVSWLTRGGAGALLLRGAGAERRPIARAPTRRAAELRVLRDDLLLLGGADPDPIRARAPELAAMAAELASETAGVAIAARVLRGVFERPDRRRS